MDFETIRADSKRDVARLRVLAERLKTNPNDVEALIEWGFLRTVDAFDINEALEAFNKALSIDKNNAEIYFWLATTYYLSFCDLDRARAALEKSIEIEPLRADCHDFLSEILNQFGKYPEQSLYHVKKAVELEPTWIYPRMRLISMFLKNGKLELAEALAQETKDVFDNMELPKPSTIMEKYYEDCVRGRIAKSKKRIEEVIVKIKEKRQKIVSK